MAWLESRSALGSQVPDLIPGNHRPSFLPNLSTVGFVLGVGSEAFRCDGVEGDLGGGEQGGGLADVLLEVFDFGERVGQVRVRKNTHGE